MPSQIWKQTCENCANVLIFEEGVDTVTCSCCRRPVTRLRTTANAASLLEEADRLLQQLRFDDAQEKYIEAAYADPDSLEALWGQFRCRHGVELLYEDTTGDRFLVCHKHDSVRPTLDPVYRCLEKRIKEAKPDKRCRQYLADAQDVDGEWREYNTLLEQHARPSDVFLCYKETDRVLDEGGNVKKKASADRAWVAEFYKALTARLKEQGSDVQVFYAPETLKHLVGIEYAASISYALATARVMLLITGKAEYLQEERSTWVSSEWKRFMRYRDVEHLKRTLVPVLLGNMRPSDLPAELSKIQLIMSKEGEMQDAVDQAVNSIRKQLAVADPLDSHRWRWINEQYEEIKKKLRENLSAFAARDKELETVRKQIELLQDQLREKTEAVSEQEETIKQKDIVIGTKEADYFEALRKLFEMEKKNKEQQSELTSKKNELESARRRNEEQEKRIQELTVELEKKVSSAAEELKRAKSAAADQLDKERSGAAASLQAAREESQKELARLRKSLERAEVERDVQQDSARKSQARLQQVERELQDLKDSAGDSGKQLKAAEKRYELLDLTLKETENDLSAAKLEIARLKRQVEQAAKPAPQGAAAPDKWAVNGHGFGCADGTTYPETLQGVGRAEIKKIDRIFFRLWNKSDTAQSNVMVRIIDAGGGKENLSKEFKLSFGPRKSSPFYVELSDPTDVNRAFTVTVTDRKGEKIEVGTIEYKGKA